MFSEQKPREFWIVKGEYVGEGGSENPFYSSVFGRKEFTKAWLSEKERSRFIRVIEYSAYEKLQQENIKLKEQLAEITRGGLVKIADLPFEVKISSSIYIGEPMMFLPPKDFSDLEKHIKEKGITIESAGK